MNVLGLNFSLDAAAVLLGSGGREGEGRVIAAACQERFDRVKHSGAFPRQAIDFCLESAGLDLSRVDAVAVSWNPAEHLALPNRLRDTIYRDHREYLDIIPAQLMAMEDDLEVGRRTLLRAQLGNRDLEFVYYDHHLCHAAGAFYASTFDQAAILSVDAYGETTGTQTARGGPEGIQVLGKVDLPHSLGSVYAALTTYLGFSANDGEGKVMALAGMGDPAPYRSHFDEILRCVPQGFMVDLSYFSYYRPSRTRFSKRFVEVFGPPRMQEGPLEGRHRDLAASLQEATERVLLHLVSELHRQTGLAHLCLAGGVALNAVAMGRIEREGPFQEIFVLPPAHDGGGGLGAAALLLREAGMEVMKGEYSDRLGPAPDPDKTARLLSDYSLRFTRIDDAPAAAAEMIAKGGLIAWMNGRMEFGPRALGGRSILADPRDGKIKDILNAKVKFRESFRPFAPVVLESEIDRYFENARPSPYMNKVYAAKEGAGEEIPAVVHTDGSVRMQSVNAAQDPDLTALVSHFESLTGVPMVLNTSLNRRGQPICAGVEDALFCFFTSGLDALFIGPFLIEK